MWGLILTLLKFAGVLVSGAAAIVASTPDKTSASPPNSLPTSRFARFLRSHFSKQSAVRWAISGFVVALLSQFAETLKTDTETKEAQRIAEHARMNASNQIWIAQKSLDSLERIVTRFDEIAVTIKYQLDPQCDVFAPLYKTLSNLNNAAPDPQPSSTTSRALGPPAMTHQYTPLTYNPTPAAILGHLPKVDLFSSISGYVLLPGADNTSIQLSFGSSLDHRTFEFPGLDAGMMTSLNGANTNSMISQAIRCIYNPGFDIKLFSAKRAPLVKPPAQPHLVRLGSNGPFMAIPAIPLLGPKEEEAVAPDLFLLVTNLARAPQITYDCVDRHIFMTYSLDCPKRNWQQSQTKRMLCLPDLAESKLLISLSAGNATGIHPVSAVIHFDLTAITLTNFEHFSGSCFTTRLPKKAQILSYE